MDPIVDAVKDLLEIRVNAWMAGCLAVGVIAIVTAFVLKARIAAQEEGSAAMQRAGRAIHVGARAYLRIEVAAIGVLALVGAALLVLAFNGLGDAWTTGLAFLVGAAASAIAGTLGLRTAAAGGARAAHAAATKGLGASLRTAYLSGAAAGLFNAGFGVVAITGLYLGTGDPLRMFAFALGASATALVARVGGGIFAKAADVGVSLAIRADQAIPDDSAANAGVVADDVGDCARGVAGMGSDVAESAAAAAIAAMALGAGAFTALEKHGKPDVRAAIEGLRTGPSTLVLFPVALFAVGILAALVAALFVKTENERNVGAALHRTVIVATALMVAGATALTFGLGLAAPEVTQALTGAGRDANEPWRTDVPGGVLFAAIAGLVLGVALGRISEWYTSDAKRSARRLAEESAAGPPTNVLNGLALGMASSMWPTLLVAGVTGFAFYMAGAYGVALAAVGLLSTLAVPVAVHAFGSVAANACGVADMVRVGPDTRRRTDALASAASNTAVLGKSYATGAAAMTVFALLVTFRETYERLHPGTQLRLDLTDVDVLLGLAIGAMVPYLFASWCIRAVGRVARTLCDEIVQHFRDAKPSGEEAPHPDPGRFVAGAARRSLRRMGAAALLAIGTPIACGFSPLGARGLAGLLVGATLSATMLAFTLTNAGAAWNSARRYVASGVFGGKGSPAYKAGVIGDVVGDPLKDAAGPGMHTLIKLMALLALVLLPFFPA